MTEPGEPLARIEQLITQLVQSAPALDPAAADELVARLQRVGSPLARSIARVVELVAEQLVAPGIALPPLAMACATLVDGVRGKLPASALEAARFEIETLLPLPDHPGGAGARPTLVAPDVPLVALNRKKPTP
ncbi:MAG TPA: hypothetical protein VGC42_24965 [Kofleriaceae bacterium]